MQKEKYGYIYRTFDEDYTYIGKHIGNKFDDKYSGSGYLLKHYMHNNPMKTVIIKWCFSRGELAEAETEAIKWEKEVFGDNCLNIANGFCEGFVRKHSEETKDKLRQLSLGRKHSEETKEKIRQSALLFRHSEETKKKMSESRKGLKRPITEETRRKISESLKGHKHTKETKEKLSRIVTGRKHSEESKKKMRLAKLGKKRK